MIDLRDDRFVDPTALAALRERSGFSAEPIELLERENAGSRWLVHAHEGDRLVGFARAISDGASFAYLKSVMVDPEYRRRGIARAMLDQLFRDRDHIKFVLHTRRESEAFYASLGFTRAADMMVRDRR